MRRFSFILVTAVANGERCSLPDFQTAMTSNLGGIEQVLTPCLSTPGFSDIAACFQNGVAQINNPCLDCIAAALDPRSIVCMMNCAIDPTKEDCDKCGMGFLERLFGNCLPVEIAGLLQGQLGQGGPLGSIFGNITQPPIASNDYPIICSLSDVEDARTIVTEYITCVDNLPAGELDWSSCNPSISSVCGDCLALVFQSTHTSCFNDCVSGYGLASCKLCITNTASLGIGRCTGALTQPPPSPCSPEDAALYSDNGEAQLLQCINSQGNDITTCLDGTPLTGLGQQCKSCLAAAPAWSSTVQSCSCGYDPSNNVFTCEDNCNNTPEVVDSVSVRLCFDPYNMRRSDDTERDIFDNTSQDFNPFNPACSLDDLGTLNNESGQLIDCMVSDLMVPCFERHVSTSSTCSQCMRATMTATDCTDIDCFDKAITTSAGICLYSGFPLSSLTVEGGDLSTTTSQPESTTVSGSFTLSAFALIVASSALFVLF